MFVANRYSRKIVKKYMREMKHNNQERGGDNNRGIVTTPYLKGFSEQFKRVAA